MGGYGGDPYHGAYRHCVATCLLTKQDGAFGRGSRRLWDWINESAGASDSGSDMQGEDVGEFFGCNPGGSSCESLCMSAYPPAR